MILKTESNCYINLSHFAFLGVGVSRGGAFKINAFYPDSENSDELFQSEDEAIAQTILDEIMHRWISGDKFYNLSTILDEIYRQEDAA